MRIMRLLKLSILIFLKIHLETTRIRSIHHKYHNNSNRGRLSQKHSSVVRVPLEAKSGLWTLLILIRTL